MTAVKRFKDGNLDVECPMCGSAFTSEVPAGFAPKFLDMFQQYENLVVECSECAKQGKPTSIHINLNLPEGELDEEDIEYMMPFGEINARKYIRDIMWAVRPDLKGRDRAEFNLNRPRVPREMVEAARKEFGDFSGKGAE